MSSATGSGASTGSQGQRPTSSSAQQQNDPDASGASSGHNGASGTNPPAGDNDGGTIANPEAKRYADEAAQTRKQLRDAEAELKKFRDAQLSDQQKMERDFTDLQAKVAEYELRDQQKSLRIAGLELAPTLGIADPAAALALIQAEHGTDIKVGADGTIENLPELFKQVLKDHPVLSGQQQRQPSAPTSGGVTNPGRNAGNGGLTLEIIKAMPTREKMARMEEIKAWERAQQ